MGRTSNAGPQPRPSSGAPDRYGGELTTEALEALLGFLGPDRWSAAREYEALRRKLLRLFEWRGCPCPEELADRTFDRAARLLEEGTETHTKDRYAYLRGTAQNIFLEFCREEQRVWREMSSRPWLHEGGASLDAEQRLAALDRCLEELTRRARSLLLDYHAAPDDGRRRARLARRLGMTTNALTVRAHRLRKNVEGCVRQRLEGSA